MNIAFVEIKNFRKLESCRIDLSPKSTVFVGANNSGKTSAMIALVKFLKIGKLVLDDFTLSNLASICHLGERYINDNVSPKISDWKGICPFLDVWLNVREDELRYVADIIPTLSWRSGLLGVRLICEPKDAENLFNNYVQTYALARKRSEKVKLWPLDFADFLQQKMKNHFVINAYILDPSKVVSPLGDNVALPQEIPDDSFPLCFDPFKKLIRVDIISAQRWLEDSGEKANDGWSDKESNLLSTQLRDYYDRQLDPEQKPSASDLKALNELQTAKELFDKQISKRFQRAMEELSKFGYPGRFNPGILIESKAHTNDIISHSTVVKYPVFNDGNHQYKLPEKFNGLGYQNLISMSFKLMSFRDSWVNGDRRKADEEEIETMQPLHLVLIEEPEAHLHVQVQQVFIKNAYSILRNHSLLKNKTDFCTQMVVSTHSSSIAAECEFSTLRYFRRTKSPAGLPISVVVNLQNVFGASTQTSRFVTRYLKTTHCDLFFADAVILIEGAGERIFMPYFLDHYETLNDSYITVLEINGRYAHYLKPLINTLGISCLIITDLDSAKGRSRKGVMPERNKGYFSSNPTIQNWIICKTDLDYLLSLGPESKIETNPNIADAHTRIAYQTPICVNFSDGSEHEFLPTTFEDALAYTNFNAFKTMRGNGLIKKFRKAFDSENESKISRDVYSAVESKSAKKAEFALDMIYNRDPNSIKIPKYISEGLSWLESEITSKANNDFLGKEDDQ